MKDYTLIDRARYLRQHNTDAEKRLWYHLRGRRIGFKFKRQVPIGNYIVDLVCLDKRLIVEVDGGQHLENEIYDKQRTDWLNKEGFRVLRFWNNAVLKDTGLVLEDILKALNSDEEEKNALD